jgi:hypothetical protein
MKQAKPSSRFIERHAWSHAVSDGILAPRTEDSNRDIEMTPVPGTAR